MRRLSHAVLLVSVLIGACGGGNDRPAAETQEAVATNADAAPTEVGSKLVANMVDCDRVAVHDSGRIINPSICENQVSGGALIGSGFALTEDLVWDAKTGRVLNPNFADYKILNTLDTPPMDISFVDVVDPVGPFGVKSIGEGATCPTPTAIAQALYNAIGVRLNAPFTPERVLEAIKAQRTERGRS